MQLLEHSVWAGVSHTDGIETSCWNTWLKLWPLESKEPEWRGSQGGVSIQKTVWGVGYR